MGSLYRSEPMQLFQLFLQTDAAYSCISELGELGLLQFKDLNPDVSAFQRKYVSELRRCEEMERKLRFLESEMKRDDIPIADSGENPVAPLPREFTNLEVTFEKLENDIKEVNSNSEALKRNYLDLTELKHILRKTHLFFDGVDRAYYQTRDDPLVDPDESDSDSIVLLSRDSSLLGHLPLRISFVAGVILHERMPAFERMLWRACHGNMLLKQAPIETPLEDPITGVEIWKCVFFVFYQGEQLKDKITKICEGFRANVYPCPETQTDRRDMAMGAMTRIHDLELVLRQTQEHRQRVLLGAAASIRVWFAKVLKIKSIYHTLSLFNFDVTQKCLIGECWCPVAHLGPIQLALRRGTEHSGSSLSGAILHRMETSEAPPTYHRTNKFTNVFQDIVDSYGVANYREVNPAPFTIISFPFLFAMMFGDIGHGVLVLIAGLIMILFEERLAKINSEIWHIFFGGRYIIMLMGVFSIYTGLMYNDLFSKSINLFGSAWYPNNATRYPYSMSELHKHEVLTLDPNTSDYRIHGHPYPFGLDPVWQLATNKISFLNSFKMKISIIFGVAQMTFGIILSLQNHRYFKQPLNIICEFVPQMLFLLSIFGYLILLILYKWIAWDAGRANCAPSLLIGLINMFLLHYPVEEFADPNCSFYQGKKGFQTFLLLIAIICIPWLLLPKPLLLRRENQKRQQMGDVRWHLLNDDVELERLTGPSSSRTSGLSVQSGDLLLLHEEGEVTHHPEGEAAAHSSHSGLDGHEQFDFGEVFIHQCIHTIEFCLGCISHTASYLRLWALSLAHAELSEVLWSMVLHHGFVLGGDGYASAVTIFLIFTPWAIATVVILLFMEGLSAFLHTLRLHWVEFQSKFYKGEGHKFEPFSFEQILRRDMSEE